MKRIYIAKIKWVSSYDGGRKRPPSEGVRYCPIVMFDEKDNCRWSIDFICPNFEITNLIRFTFLSDDAPMDKIKIGFEYYLYEGNKKVAQINVIS